MTSEQDESSLLSRVERLGQLAAFEIDLTGPYSGRRSPGYCRIHGLLETTTVEQHRDWLARLHPDDRDQANAAFHAAVATGEPYHAEYRIRRPIDGEIRWISAQGEVLKNEAGEAVRMIGVHIDVTRRREAEDKARAAAELFSVLFHANPIGLIESDIYGRIHSANDAFLDIVGYTREDLSQGLRWDAISPPDSLSLDAIAIDQARREGRCDPYEKSYVRKDGERVPVLVGYTLLPPDRVRAVAYVLDLRAAKAVEAHLASIRRRHEDILQQMPTGVVVADLDERITFVNKAAAGLFDMQIVTASTPPEAGTELLNAQGETLAPNEAPLAKALRGAYVAGEEIAVRRRGAPGPHLYLRINAAPLFDAEGAQSGAVVAFENVTAEKAAAEALRRSEIDRGLALKAGKLGSWSWRQANGSMSWDDGFYRLLGYEPNAFGAKAELLRARIHPEDLPAVEQGFARLLESTTGEAGMSFRIVVADEVRWLATRGALVNDPAGGRVLYAVTWDVTREKREEIRRQLLLEEMNHRVKNAFAVAQSLVAHTLRTAPSLESARTVLGSRLRTLAAAHDALLQADWRAASVEAIMQALASQGLADRLKVRGARGAIKASQGVGLALILHELQTNAMKYGALSIPGGWVHVRWRPSKDRRRVYLVRRERRGPPARPPTREGFGLRLIQTALQTESEGSATVRFGPDGLVCRLVMAAADHAQTVGTGAPPAVLPSPVKEKRYGSTAP